jgi:hypothetical protein
MSQINNKELDQIRDQLKADLTEIVIEKGKEKGLGKLLGKLKGSSIGKTLLATIGIGGAGVGLGEMQVLSSVLGNLLPSSKIESKLESFVDKTTFDQEFENLSTIYVSRKEFETLDSDVKNLKETVEDIPSVVSPVQTIPQPRAQVVTSEPAYITALHDKLNQIHNDIKECK